MLQDVMPPPPIENYAAPTERVDDADVNGGQVTPMMVMFALSVATILGLVAVLITG